MNPNPQPSMQAARPAGNHASLQVTGRHTCGELPPSHCQPAKRYAKGWPWLVLPVAIVCAAWLAASSYRPAPANDEQSTPGWQYAQAATQSGQAMQWMQADGSLQFTSSIFLSDQDEDQATTKAIQQALAAQDWNAVEQLVARAQLIPQLEPNLPSSSHALPATGPATGPGAVEPSTAQLTPAPAATLSPGLRQEIAKGDTRFYHIHLRDNCYNDGDIVEILLNGEHAFLVPITNAGATLSIPISSSSVTVIAVRGVYDGGGGITVACRTSRGEGFMRVMTPEEIQPLGVALP